MNAKAVSERLGHGDVAVTLRTYVHITPDMHHAAVDRLAAFLG